MYKAKSVSIFRDDYEKRNEYIKDYRQLCTQYDFKVRVDGGWMFFEFVTDLLTWKNQK